MRWQVVWSRAIPLMGLVGAPLLLTAAIATLFGVIEQISAWSLVATRPVAAWEFSVGVWMVVKGFNPVPTVTNGIQMTAMSSHVADR
jgi:hypothetical protein